MIRPLFAWLVVFLNIHLVKMFFCIDVKGMVSSLNKFQNCSLSIYNVKMLLDIDCNEMDFAHRKLWDTDCIGIVSLLNEFSNVL